jgi:hypothetical protein
MRNPAAHPNRRDENRRKTMFMLLFYTGTRIRATPLAAQDFADELAQQKGSSGVYFSLDTNTIHMTYQIYLSPLPPPPPLFDFTQ